MICNKNIRHHFINKIQKQSKLIKLLFSKLDYRKNFLFVFEFQDQKHFIVGIYVALREKELVKNETCKTNNRKLNPCFHLEMGIMNDFII